MVIADSSHAGDRTMLEEWRRRESVQFVATFDEVCAAACSENGRIAVANLDACLPGGVRQLLRAFQRAHARIPVLLRTSLTRAALDELGLIAEFDDPRFPVHVSYRPMDPLTHRLEFDRLDQQHNATTLILCRMGGRLPRGDARSTFIAMCVMAEEMVSLAELAAARSSNEDTMERHLALCGFRNFRELRARFAVTHALVRYQHCGKSVSECAEALKMQPKDFSEYVKGWCGASFTTLARQGGYDALIDGILAAMSPLHDEAHPR